MIFERIVRIMSGVKPRSTCKSLFMTEIVHLPWVYTFSLINRCMYTCLWLCVSVFMQCSKWAGICRCSMLELLSVPEFHSNT
jgi:hypothetical protein